MADKYPIFEDGGDNKYPVFEEPHESPTADGAKYVGQSALSGVGELAGLARSIFPFSYGPVEESMGVSYRNLPEEERPNKLSFVSPLERMSEYGGLASSLLGGKVQKENVPDWARYTGAVAHDLPYAAIPGGSLTSRLAGATIGPLAGEAAKDITGSEVAGVATEMGLGGLSEALAGKYVRGLTPTKGAMKTRIGALNPTESTIKKAGGRDALEQKLSRAVELGAYKKSDPEFIIDRVNSLVTGIEEEVSGLVTKANGIINSNTGKNLGLTGNFTVAFPSVDAIAAKYDDFHGVAEKVKANLKKRMAGDLTKADDTRKWVWQRAYGDESTASKIEKQMYEAAGHDIKEQLYKKIENTLSKSGDNISLGTLKKLRDDEGALLTAGEMTSKLANREFRRGNASSWLPSPIELGAGATSSLPGALYAGRSYMKRQALDPIGALKIANFKDSLGQALLEASRGVGKRGLTEISGF